MATGYEKISNIKNILCKPMTVESMAISMNCKARTIYRWNSNRRTTCGSN